jgi:hypothetical protein
MVQNIKRIAVCLSGQPRTWRTAKDNILSYFDIRDKSVQVDYFIHTWDTNQFRRKQDVTWPHRYNIKVSPTEKDELIHAFNPIDIELEEYKEDEHVTLWASLLYSFMKSVWLKRKYEIENDFRYDLVIKARMDINYPMMGSCNLNFPIHKFHIHPIQNLTGYSTVPMISRFPTEFNYPCFDDVFFYANSPTIDIISNCHKWYTNIIKENMVLHSKGKWIQDSTYWYGPGTILYKYLVESCIHPQGYRFIPYYVVRKEVEECGLHSIHNWTDIRDFSHEWYDNILNKKDNPSILDKYKNKKLI